MVDRPSRQRLALPREKEAYARPECRKDSGKIRPFGWRGGQPHQLRHTFCKMLVDVGESLDRVAVLASYANLNTTAKYTKPSFQDLERAVEKLA